jgi:glycerophosphoryl diester phosphodiesterase
MGVRNPIVQKLPHIPAFLRKKQALRAMASCVRVRARGGQKGGHSRTMAPRATLRTMCAFAKLTRLSAERLLESGRTSYVTFIGKTLKRVSIALLFLGAALWLGNTSLLVFGLEDHETRLIAHRGVHHIYAGTDRSIESCHASPVEPIVHDFIENTIPSMEEAFRLGADVVEIDVHLTTDNVFAVFHDWTLDCRTNGTGVTHMQDSALLQSLDVGYWIDDGTGAFPLRGQAVGQMPTLSRVLEEEMQGLFLINFKSQRREEGLALAAMLEQTALREQVFGVYGGEPPTRAAITSTPGLRGFDRASLEACLLRYLALGWSGYVPESCHNTLVIVPRNYASFLWGWPHRFTRRLEAVGTEVILAGDYDGSGFASGIDDAESFGDVPDAFDGYVWTNRIELIGPLEAARE